MLEKELYLRSEEPGVTRMIAAVSYTGPAHNPTSSGDGPVEIDTTREEILKTSAASDDYRNWKRRISPDNGRTWPTVETLEDINVQLPDGGISMR